MCSDSEGMVGKYLGEVRELIHQYSSHKEPVLITGETGVGKELVATAIHRASKREGRFVSVNCAALPSTLLENELFGHTRGAFTGAHQAQEGRFKEAHLGTLFLDEIGDIPLPSQGKLLRILQDGIVRPLGGTKDIPVDVRVVAATNRNIEDDVTKERFRSDLFFRINVYRLHIPPLRERIEDIPLLVEYFLKEHNRDAQIAPRAVEMLVRQSWPGNVRELKSFVARLNALSPDKLITAEDVQRAGDLNSRGSSTSVSGGSTKREMLDPHRLVLERATVCIIAAVDALLLGGDVAEAAQAVELWDAAGAPSLQHDQHRLLCERILAHASHDERPVDSIDTSEPRILRALTSALSIGWGGHEEHKPKAGRKTGSTDTFIAPIEYMASQRFPRYERVISRMILQVLRRRNLWPHGTAWKARAEKIQKSANNDNIGSATKESELTILESAFEAVYGAGEQQSEPVEPHVAEVSLTLPSAVTAPSNWEWVPQNNPHRGIDCAVQIERIFAAWRERTVSYNGRRIVVDHIPAGMARRIGWSYSRYLSCADDEGVRIGVSILLQAGDDLIIQYRDPKRPAVAQGQLAPTCSGAFALAPSGDYPIQTAALLELQRELWTTAPFGPSDLRFLGVFPNPNRRVAEFAFLLHVDGEVLRKLSIYREQHRDDQPEHWESVRHPVHQRNREMLWPVRLPPYFRMPVKLLREKGFAALTDLRLEDIQIGIESQISREAPAELAQKRVGDVLKCDLDLYLSHVSGI